MFNNLFTHQKTTYPKSISLIKNWIIYNWVFVILIIVISSYLIIMAMPENHMDEGVAQAILAARWWARDGFTKHYFLELLAGYGKIALYFDEPALQEHAQGTVSGGLIGHRAYYTHYPDLWIMPIALLMKLGIEKLFFLRLYSILVSILALIFFYLFVKSLSNKFISLIAVTYFAFSPIFLKFADQFGYALEDMCWFLILLLSFWMLKKLRAETITSEKIKYWLSAIWFVYLLLCLTSFDATILIFVWLTGISAYYLYGSNRLHKIRIFIFLTSFWALAPIFGFTLQLIQNAAYLGWHNALLDISGTFMNVGNGNGLGFLTRIEGLIRPLFSMTGLYNFYSLIAPLGIGKLKQLLIVSSIPMIFVLLCLIPIIIFTILWLKRLTGYRFPYPSILILLLLSPLFQTLVLPLTGYRDGMGRFMAPFIGIIIGVIVWMLYLAFTKKEKKTVLDKIVLSTLSLIIVLSFAIQIIIGGVPRFWAPYAPLEDDQINFSKAMHNITPGEKATFMINTADTQIKEEYLKMRKGLYNPSFFVMTYIDWEYYLDMPLLRFISTPYLVRDLLYLEKRAEFPFTAIITSDDKNMIDKLHNELRTKNLPLTAIKKLYNRYYFLVSPTSKKDSLQNTSSAPTN